MSSCFAGGGGGGGGGRKTPGFGVTSADGSQVSLFGRGSGSGATTSKTDDQRGVQIADPMAAGVVLDLCVLADPHLNFRDFHIGLVHQEQFVATTITLATRAPHTTACRITMASAHTLPLTLVMTGDGNGVVGPVYKEAQEAYEAVCIACDPGRTLPPWFTSRGMRPDVQDNTLLWTIPFVYDPNTDADADAPPPAFAHASEDGIFDALAWFAWTHVRDILLNDPSWGTEALVALYADEAVARTRQLLELTTTPVTTSYDARARAIELCVRQFGHLVQDVRNRVAARLCAAALERPAFACQSSLSDVGALRLLALDDVAGPQDMVRTALWLESAATFLRCGGALPVTSELSATCPLPAWGFGLLLSDWARRFRNLSGDAAAALAARIHGGAAAIGPADAEVCARFARAAVPAERLGVVFWLASSAFTK